MAATKLIAMHQNKGRSVMRCLKDRTDYAMNGEKTDEGKYISSYQCNPELVDLEFAQAKKEYLHKTWRQPKGDVIAYQIRQSFKPGEITPEEANEVGYETGMRFTKGKHAFIVATHVDRAHIHNHIIFNSTNLECDRKFRDFWFSGIALQRLSDIICLEHGLSVIPKVRPSERQRRTKYPERVSIRDVIREDILKCLDQKPADFEELLKLLQAEGYEIKRGKYISFRAPGQERFTRAKTLGEAYTEEAIAERIKGKVILKTPKPERSGVSLLIDIENCIKAQQSAGYERWAKIENLKRAARTMVFLDQHGISHYTDLEQKITELQDSNEQTAAALKTAEHRLSDLALLIKHTATYKELKPLYSEYKKSHDKEKYLRGREREIILFEASARALKAAGVGDKLPDLAKLREEYSRLSEEKNRLYAEYGSLKKRMREYDAVKQNIDSILSPNRGQEQDKAL